MCTWLWWNSKAKTTLAPTTRIGQKHSYLVKQKTADQISVRTDGRAGGQTRGRELGAGKTNRRVDKHTGRSDKLKQIKRLAVHDYTESKKKYIYLQAHLCCETISGYTHTHTHPPTHTYTYTPNQNHRNTHTQERFNICIQLWHHGTF